jgi:DNA-binding transcriptional LysR family regulator
MELRHLRYFVAAAEEQHLSRAADRLCVTRPAVSRMVSDLEKELGAQLFERSANGIKLTAAGALLLERVQSNLMDLNLTFDLTKRLALGKSGVLNIGYGATSLHHPVFRAAVKQVRGEFPDIVLSFAEGRRIEHLNGLRDGNLHLAFVLNPVLTGGTRKRARVDINSVNDLAEFARIPIQTAALAAALPRGHALADRKSLKLTDLAGEDFVTVALSSSVPSSERLLTLCLDAGFQARSVHEVKTAAAQLSLVSIGMGIGILVTVPSRRYPDDIVVIPLEGISFPIQLDLLWLKSRQNEPLIKQFTNIVRQSMVESR